MHGHACRMRKAGVKKCGGGGGPLRENPTTQTRTEEVRGSSADWRGQRWDGEEERGEGWRSWRVMRSEWRGERMKGGKAGLGGGVLPVTIPASPHRQAEGRRILGHMTFSLGPLPFLHAEWCASSLPSPSLPPSLPSPALQSFDMSSPTTKTEVGRLAGATAASGCLALKLPANTAGRGGEAGGGEEPEKTGGTEEGDRDRKVKKKKKAGPATLLNPWASKCVCGRGLLLRRRSLRCLRHDSSTSKPLRSRRNLLKLWGILLRWRAGMLAVWAAPPAQPQKHNDAHKKLNKWDKLNGKRMYTTEPWSNVSPLIPVEFSWVH